MDAPSGAGIVRWIGLGLGPLLGVAAYLLLPGATYDADGALVSGLTPGARGVGAVATLMAAWWLTEAIPLSATALLPIVLLPLLGGIGVKQATAPYASDFIFLFLGGFILGLGMEKWGLHKRIALITITLVGTGPRRIIAGFMIAAALMSMWVSNTATAVMMLPIAVSVSELVHQRLGENARDKAPNFDTCLMLGVAYACSIGGIGSLIGTPPNLVLKGFVEEEFGITITMARWFAIGLPLVAVFLPVTWLFLTRVAYPIRLRQIPGGRELIRGELSALGPMKRGEWAVFLVFVVTAALWVTRPLLVGLGRSEGIPALTLLSDAGIGVGAAIALFVIPIDPRGRVFAMDWETAARLPWGILLLFGGGLSLAAAIKATGVDAYLGGLFAHLQGAPVIVLVGAVALGVIFLTEMTSNTAVTTTLMPILAGAAVGLDVHPAMLLVPATLAASCAFMLPVATPPNAIVFGSGRVGINQMVKAGFWLNLIGVGVVTVVSMLMIPVLTSVSA